MSIVVEEIERVAPQAATFPELVLITDEAGRFNVNAVHHHFGLDAAKKVSAWAKMKCTQQLIEMAQVARAPSSPSVFEVIGPKHKPTTFANELLILNYAAWHSDACYGAVQAALKAHREAVERDDEGASQTEEGAIKEVCGPIAFVPEDVCSPTLEIHSASTRNEIAQAEQNDAPASVFDNDASVTPATASGPTLRLNPEIGRMLQAQKKTDAPVFDFVRKMFDVQDEEETSACMAVEWLDGAPFISTFMLAAHVGMPHLFVRQFIDVYRSNFEALGDLSQVQAQDAESGYRLNESQALLLVSYLPAGVASKGTMDLRVSVIKAFDAHRAQATAVDPGALVRHLRAAAEWIEGASEREASFKATISMLQDQASAAHAKMEQLQSERDQAIEKARKWIAIERAQYQDDPEIAGLSLSQAAKTLGWKPLAFMDWLEDNKWAFRRQPSMPLEPYQERIDQGFMKVKMKTFEDKTGEQITQPSARLTLKGLDFLKTVL